MSKYVIVNYDNGIFQKDYTSLIGNSLKISHRILFQCASISNSFLAIACNTGNIYVFNIQNKKFKYWSNIISNDSPIVDLQFSTEKNYLAYHNKKYQIFIYKLNLTNEKNVMIRQIDSTQNSPVQTLCWDDECNRIFCGYANGIVDIVYLPQNTKDYFQIPTEKLLKLDRQEIVQMDFIKDILLISTNEKVILMNIQSKYLTFVGSKPRSGEYGACFWFDNSKHLRVVSARPGYRLWIASVDGTVEETQQYKSWNNSLKYKVKEDETRTTGSGQFTFLAMIKNSDWIIASENEGLIFIIDLVKKSCISVIDYGTSLSKIIYNTERLILSSPREVVYISVIPFKEAVLNFLDEDVDHKYVIDLFLNLASQSEEDPDSNIVFDNRQIFNTLSPDLLLRLVQKAAEFDYKFHETNKLQVFIQDNAEYQRIFCLRDKNDYNSLKESVGTIDSLNDASLESDGSSDPKRYNGKNVKKSEKGKAFVKAPQLLKTIYDKTSNFLTNMDVLSSSNSDCHVNMVESYSDMVVHDDFGLVESYGSHSIVNSMPENLTPTINLMELEANGYIASEKFKQLHLDEDNKSDFIESLTNFCETWLSLNLNHWQQLKNFEIHVRNLSATFPIFNVKTSISSSDSSNTGNDMGSFINEQLNSQVSNSWSSTVNSVDWFKALPVSEKIYQMTSNLLCHCFFYETFCKFPELIKDITYITGIAVDSFDSPSYIESYSNYYYEEYFDKATQSSSSFTSPALILNGLPNDYLDLYEVLSNEIWSPQSDGSWISPMIKLFYDLLNIKSLRHWMKSGISHSTWLTALSYFKEIYFPKAIMNGDIPLSEMSIEDIEKMLFESLCTDDIRSFVVVDGILAVMKERKNINWKILIESENLDCRDILHFSLKYNLDITDYILDLFKYVNFSIKFSSRYSLLEHMYSQPDVIVSFIYFLLTNKDRPEKIQRCCDCGLLSSFFDINLPENINSLSIEILRWGASHGIFKKNSQLLHILMNLCLDASFHQGYIELLVGMSFIEELVKIGIQACNEKVLERLKDCDGIRSTCVVEVIELIIDCRRKQTSASSVRHCLNCAKIIQFNDVKLEPLSWNVIGRLIFTKLIEPFNHLEIVHKILPKLTTIEMDQMKDMLKKSIENVIATRRLSERNQMMKFIKTEMNPEEANGELTERYLNIYSMSRHELSGPNWGRVLTDNMRCDLCGAKLITKTEVLFPSEVVGLCCNHTFHRDCFLQFSSGDDCFLC